MTQEHTQVYAYKGKKEILVDELVAPLVEWLNDLPGVDTIASCQGDTGPDFPDGLDRLREPYVLFHCDDLDTLDLIAQVVYNFSSTCTEDELYSGKIPVSLTVFPSFTKLGWELDLGLRFSLRIKDTSFLERFSSFIQGNKKIARFV